MNKSDLTFLQKIKVLAFYLLYNPMHKTMSFLMKLNFAYLFLFENLKDKNENRRMKKRSECYSDLNYMKLVKKREKQLVPKWYRDA